MAENYPKNWSSLTDTAKCPLLERVSISLRGFHHNRGSQEARLHVNRMCASSDVNMRQLPGYCDAAGWYDQCSCAVHMRIAQQSPIVYVVSTMGSALHASCV